MMLVPSRQLLLWVGVLGLPCATLLGVLPDFAWLPGLLTAALGILVGLDAFLAGRRLRGIGVAFPPVQRFTKDHDGTVELRLTHAAAQSRRLRVGLRLPADLCSPHSELPIMLPEGQATTALLWPVTPRQRGQYHLSACYLESASPLQFWAVRTTLPVACEIRVYPNLWRERRHLAALFLPHHGPGVQVQRQVGQGHDFETLRKYVAGDSYSDLHWKATARRGYPVTKTFQVERTQEVYVLIDASRLSNRPAQHDGDLLLERFVTAALVLALAAEKQGDLFGLLVFNDRIRTFVPARTGKMHYNVCRDAVYRLQPQMVTPDFDELFTFIRLRLRRRALLLCLTNLDDPVLAESFVRNVDLICRQHLLSVNMLPATTIRPLFSNAEVDRVETIYQHLGGHLVWQRLRQLTNVLQRHGVNCALLENETLCLQLVSDYIRIKQRQLL